MIETGQVHYLLRLFVLRAANTENVPRSHMGLDHSASFSNRCFECLLL